MSYPVEQIITIATSIRAAGLGLANFGQGMLFVEGDAPSDDAFAVDTYRDYSSAALVAEDFDLASEAYMAAQRWFSAMPKPRQLRIYVRNTLGEDPASAAQSVTKAIQDGVWFYWAMFTREVYESDSDVLALAALCDANEKFFVNCQSAADIIDPASTGDVASLLTELGSRRVFTLRHSAPENFESSYYGAIQVAAIFSTINFSATDSTITGNHKKLPGVQAEDLSLTAYNAMISKKVAFYTQVETGGQVDNGRVINSITHSAFGEYIDDVFNLDAFVNALKVGVYNALANVPTKLKQTPAGQQVLIDAANQVGERYIRNGYLGEREYTNPETAQETLSRGYEVLTVAEDILRISDEDRAARKSAPIRMRLFRAGAIHTVDIAVDVE